MRDDKITIAKAIGIILMVVVHAGLPQMEANFIIMFHMPLFFIVSGYCFKEKYLSNNTDFIKRKIKGLYIPYIKYALLFLLLHNLFFHLNIYNDSYGFKNGVSHIYSIKEYIIKAFHIITGMWDHEQLLGGYWFIKQLFLSSILSFFILKNWQRHLLFILTIIMLICFLTNYFNFRIPYIGVDSLTLLSTFFFILGYYIQKHKLPSNSTLFNILHFIIVLISSILFPTSMLKFNYTNLIPYTIAAIAGTLLTLNLSSLILKLQYKIIRNTFLYIGNNTLPILTFHFLAFKLFSLVLILIENRPIQQLAYFPIIEDFNNQQEKVMIYSLFGICIPLLIYSFTNKIKFYFKSLSKQSS